MLLTAENCIDLAYGGTIFGTGGGLPLSLQLALFERLQRESRPLNLIAIDELADDALICCVHGVGPAGDFSDKFLQAVQNGIRKLERLLGRAVSGVFPVEVNIEAAVFASIAPLGLPLIDADTTGGRAVPEIRMDNFFLEGRAVDPVVVANMDGEVVVLEPGLAPQAMERKIRELAERSAHGIAAVVDHGVAAALGRQVLSLGVISRSMRIGEILRQNSAPSAKLAALQRLLGAREVMTGCAQRVNLSRQGGFLQGTYEVLAESGETAALVVQNENMRCRTPRGELRFPELITAVSHDTMVGIHLSGLREGDRVRILHLPCEARWQRFETCGVAGDGSGQPAIP